MALGGEIPRYNPPGKAPSAPKQPKQSTGPQRATTGTAVMPQNRPSIPRYGPTPPIPVPVPGGNAGTPDYPWSSGAIPQAPSARPGAIPTSQWQKYADQQATDWWTQQLGLPAGTVLPAGTQALIDQWSKWASSQAANAATGATLDQQYNTSVYNSNAEALDGTKANDLIRNQEGAYRNGLDMYGHQIARDLLGKQGVLADKQYAADQARIAQMLGYTDRDLGYVEADFGLANRRAMLSRSTSERGNLSAATASGAMTSAGFRDNNRDIINQFRLAMDANANNRDQGVDSVGRNRDALAKSDTDSDLAYQGGVASREAQAANLALADQATESIAREYGASKSDIEIRYKQAMTNLGLDYNKTMQQIGQNLASGNADIIAQTLQFMTQLLTTATGAATGPATPDATLDNPSGTRFGPSAGPAGGMGPGSQFPVALPGTEPLLTDPNPVPGDPNYVPPFYLPGSTDQRPM